jgi:hypothetical protein
LLDGTGRRALSAGPAVVRTAALGAGRTPLVTPASSLTVRGARLCTEISFDPAVACLDPADFTALSPHFAPFFPVSPEAGRLAVDLTWAVAGHEARMRPARPVSVAGDSSVALRIIVPPNTTGTRFGVALTDRRGRRAELGDVTVDGLPATGSMTAYWAQEVRVPLAAARGLDLAHVTELRLVARTGAGQAWLLDAWGWRAGTPAPRPVALPRIDLGETTVAEGAAGVRTATMPVIVTGRGTGQLRWWMDDPGSSRTVSRLVTVHPGDRRVTIPISWTGDSRWGGDDVLGIEAKAVRGVVVGDSRGSLTVREGGTLAWRIAVSARTEEPITVSYAVRPPATGPELSTADVDPGWLRAHALAEPLPARPLSQVRLALRVTVDPATGFAVLRIPTITDRRTEPDERVRLVGRAGLLPPTTDLRGTVTGG